MSMRLEKYKKRSVQYYRECTLQKLKEELKNWARDIKQATTSEQFDFFHDMYLIVENEIDSRRSPTTNPQQNAILTQN